MKNANFRIHPVFFIALFLLMLGTGITNAQSAANYTISSTPKGVTALSGTKTIPGNYATLTAAIAAVTSAGVDGPLVLELQAGYTSGSETFPITIGSIPGASATNTITIRPAVGATGREISSDNATATIDLNGARHVVIDGRPGGTGTAKQLTVRNTNSSGAVILLINDASFNTLRYLTISGTTTKDKGVVFFAGSSGSTGNDDNTVSFCDITNTSSFVNGVYSSKDVTRSNDNNTVSNSNFSRFFSGFSDGTPGTGIRLDGGSNWNILNNSFYAAQSYSFASSSQLFRVIYVADTTSNNILISGNYIGGTAALCGGTPFTVTSFFAGSSAIYLNCGTVAPSSVQGNTIANFSFTNTGSTGTFYGIYVFRGSVTIGTETGNLIGSMTGTGSITSSTAATNYMIYNVSTNGNTVIRNNSIGGITAANTLYCIYVSGKTGEQQVIAANTIGGTVANSVSSSGNSSIMGIYTTSNSVIYRVDSNTVRNLTSSSTESSAAVYGIYISSKQSFIRKNTIHSLSTATSSSNNNLVGIYLSSSFDEISGNTIHSLTHTNSGAMNQAKAFGMFLKTGSLIPATVERNFIHSISLSTTTSVSTNMIYGIYLNSGSANFRNNMIRLGINKDGNTVAGGYRVNGIIINSYAECSAYHNSVYIGGSGVTGTQPSAALIRETNEGKLVIANNIFVNERSNGTGTGKHYAIFTNGTSLFSSNYNLFRASGVGGILGTADNGTTGRTSLLEWQTATANDGNSATGDPKFVSPTGNAATVNLHIDDNVANPSPAEGSGTLISSVTEDFDGETRSTLTPVDIGADAANFTAQDLFAPAISFTPFTHSAGTGNRTLASVTVTDRTGVPTSGVNQPRLWFRRSSPTASAWGSTQGSKESGTETNGVWSFLLDYSIISVTPAVGDVYEYYIAAQDAASPINIGTFPTGGSHPDVTTQTTAPGTPLTYTIGTSLSGTVHVPGTYPTLTGAGGFFAAVNSATVTGNITVSITGDITEDGTNGLNEWKEGILCLNVGTKKNGILSAN